MNQELRQRTIKTLEWMIADMKWRFDESRGSLDEGSSGGYSPELTEAINILEELKKGV